MTTLQDRVTRGIPAGGQFAATVHTEPTATLAPAQDAGSSDPQSRRNLTRAVTEVPDLTEEQKAGLRRHRTPIKGAMAGRSLAGLAEAAAGNNDRVRAIQDRLNAR